MTLSFVITACEATGTATIWRFTRTTRSRIGRTKNTPGPFAPTERPSRKITARSYSWTILIELASTMIARTTTRITMAPTASAMGTFLLFGRAQAGWATRGATVRVMPEWATTETGSPADRGWVEVAFQSDPSRRTVPEAPSQRTTSAARPT